MCVCVCVVEQHDFFHALGDISSFVVNGEVRLTMRYDPLRCAVLAPCVLLPVILPPPPSSACYRARTLSLLLTVTLTHSVCLSTYLSIYLWLDVFSVGVACL